MTPRDAQTTARVDPVPRAQATRAARRVRSDRPIEFTGSWPSAAAWGAGLIECALGAGAIVGADVAPAARVVGALLVPLGLATLVWGAATLRIGRLLVARGAVAGAVGGVAGTATLLLLAPARTSPLAVTVATAFLVIVGTVCALAVRRREQRYRDAGTLRGLVGLGIAAAILAVTVTPAVGATQSAVLLRDDGTLPVVTHGH